MDLGIWKRNYRLDEMTLPGLWVAFFMHYTIQTYLVLAAVSGYFAFSYTTALWPLAASALAAVIVYPLAWYLLHRYVLHGQYLYRSPMTARVWKRIHFDHHRDPHDLHVLFGALYTTLPTIALVTAPFGWIIGGLPGLLMAFCAGLLITCFYEFCHCIQHLNYAPKWPFLQTMKRLHLRHHFHDENSNYGITNFIPDRLFGTYRPKAAGQKPSPTVFNLGYTMDEVRKYPWVAQATPDIDETEAVVKGVERRKPKPAGNPQKTAA
jgi:sterol desaturase/sphingolipid hydroxylase (fatty acid hydroxylase superfamily)